MRWIIIHGPHEFLIDGRRHSKIAFSCPAVWLLVAVKRSKDPVELYPIMLPFLPFNQKKTKKTQKIWHCDFVCISVDNTDVTNAVCQCPVVQFTHYVTNSNKHKLLGLMQWISIFYTRQTDCPGVWIKRIILQPYTQPKMDCGYITILIYHCCIYFFCFFMKMPSKFPISWTDLLKGKLSVCLWSCVI